MQNDCGYPCYDCHRDCEIPCWKVEHGLVRPVVHGKWVPHFEDYRGMMESNKCSVCGYEYYGTLYNFCPNCGAMMDGGSNNA